MEFLPCGLGLFIRRFKMPPNIARLLERRTVAAAVIASLYFCVAPSESRAECFSGRSILAFDLDYLGTGLKNNGWGIGLSYEAELFRRFAAKGGFSHMTMMPQGFGMTVTTVGISLEALCYPFGRGLDWLYAGAGLGTDFIMYDGGGISGGKLKDTLISLIGEVGWKQNFFGYVMADAFFCCSIPLNSGGNAFSSEIARSGLKYGVRVKLNIPAIFKLVFRRKPEKSNAAATEIPME